MKFDHFPVIAMWNDQIQGFLTLALLTFGPDGGGYPMNYRMSNSIPGLYPLDTPLAHTHAHTHTYPSCSNKNVSRCPLGNQIVPSQEPIL